MNLKELREIIEIVSEKGFAEFEIERQGFRLRITRFPEQASSSGNVAAPQPVGQPAAVEPAPKAPPQEISRAHLALAAPGPAAERRVVGPSASGETALHIIKAPIVGTYYRSPSPDSDPFVEVGSEVGPDSVVCIIEARKLMNEI